MIRVGILGGARVAEKHAIPAFKNSKDIELVTISSRDPEKAKEWAVKHEISSDESHDSLLSREDIDAVYLPLPIGSHEEWAVKAAKAKKHIICEKSISDNYESAKKIIEACKENNVILSENLVSDLHPQHIEVVKAISEGKIGKPFIFKGYYGLKLQNKNWVQI